MNKIMFVDDDPNLIQLMIKYLECNNYEIAAALNENTLEVVRQGVAAIQQEKPSLVVVDGLVKVENVAAVIQAAKAVRARVIIFTFSTKEEHRHLDADRVVDKNISLEDFKEIIDELLEEAGNE